MQNRSAILRQGKTDDVSEKTEDPQQEWICAYS